MDKVGLFTVSLYFNIKPSILWHMGLWRSSHNPTGITAVMTDTVKVR
jgi:hypothetical protein